jgi:signal transduction histidine kinase
VNVVQARAGDVACIVIALFVGGLATEATDVTTGSYAAVNDLVGLGAAAMLWWRRRAPLTVAAITFVAAAVAPMATGAAIVGVYVIAAHHPRRVPVAMVVLYVVSAGVGMVLFPDQDLGRAGSLLVGVPMTVAAFGWGLAVRARGQLVSSLADRAERAEADQRARIVEARRAERVRIASEMHDSLAHRLSMLSLHAGAIELRPDAPPEVLARAAGIVRSNAHQALEDLRAVIGVLRDDTANGLTPLPTAADLDALLEECRGAGMHIDVSADLSAPLEAMPAELGRHVYRIVQEGMTNARKHAAAQPVELDISGQPGDRLRIEITNPAGAPASRPNVPGSGVGLIGLRERVELLGGNLDHAVDATGNHRLRVWLPWPK